MFLGDCMERQFVHRVWLTLIARFFWDRSEWVRIAIVPEENSVLFK